MRRIKYKVTPQNFAKKEEKYFHVAFIIISTSVAATSLATGSINPQTHGSLCGIGSYKPVDCDESTDMVCEIGGGNATKAITAIGGGFISIAFFALVVILALCTDHVYRVERQLNIPAREIGNVGNNDMSEEPEWRFWIKALITPLGGVFNILIYTRPKVLKCKESYPHVLMFKLFIVVLISGGEIPSMVDVKQRREWRNYSHDDENHRPLRNRSQSNIGDGEQQQQDDDNDSYSKYEVLYDMDISDAEELLSMMEYARNGYLRSVLGTTAYNQR